MSVTFYVPQDAAALSVGADAVAEAIRIEAGKRGIAARIIRNGSRGMLWLEPLVEVATQEGRMAFGPVEVDDVPALFDAGMAEGRGGLGPTEDLAFLKAQTRFTFARCGVIAPACRAASASVPSTYCSAIHS